MVPAKLEVEEEVYSNDDEDEKEDAEVAAAVAEVVIEQVEHGFDELEKDNRESEKAEIEGILTKEAGLSNVVVAVA